jgi:dTDP-4-amino-4,6-dideoxygalactose transaminase
MPVPYLDLKAQYSSIRDEITAAIEPVLANAQYVLGPAVESFERDFAEYCGCRHAVGVNSGTSALHLSLLALGVKPGDEVVVPAMTFVATAMAVAYTGATPVFCDVDPDYCCMDPKSLENAISPRTVGVIPVHLYGHPANLDSLQAVCHRHGLFLLEDACQAHGARWHDQPCGSFGSMACFSFYPGKNLGAAGESGAIVTQDAILAEKVRILRDWGQKERYKHECLAYNYRMEGIQGAILSVKLRHLPAWTRARRTAADHYRSALNSIEGLVLPSEHPNAQHIYHIFAARHPKRNLIRERLSAAGIQTGLHYPIPLHLQPCFKNLGYKQGQFPVSERIAQEELSLPMYPELAANQIDEVAKAVASALT